MHRQLLVADALAERLVRSLGMVCRRVEVDGRWLREALPDVDVLVVGQRALDDAAGARASGARPALVVVGDDETADATGDCLHALRAGATAWLAADSPTADLLGAVTSALEGHLWFPAAQRGDVVLRLLESERAQGRLRTLSPREREVLHHLVEGRTAAQTAAALFVSLPTVRSHRARVMAKLGVHTALEAAAVARRAGLDGAAEGAGVVHSDEY